MDNQNHQNNNWSWTFRTLKAKFFNYKENYNKQELSMMTLKKSLLNKVMKNKKLIIN